jgi:hypothetical protein
VPFVGLGVALAVKHMTEVRATVVADRLQATKILAHSYVAGVARVVALVERLGGSGHHSAGSASGSDGRGSAGRRERAAVRRTIQPQSLNFDEAS